jgi:hypothetical protein
VGGALERPGLADYFELTRLADIRVPKHIALKRVCSLFVRAGSVMTDVPASRMLLLSADFKCFL